MKYIINLSLFKSFRKSFLKVILNSIEINRDEFCCEVWSWHNLFICWKNLKEVQENLESDKIRFWIRVNKEYNCGRVWFSYRENRIAFLKECLNKF